MSSSASSSRSASPGQQHDDEHQQALDQLAAHGAAFLAAFGEPVKHTQPPNNKEQRRQQKRRREEEEQASTSGASTSAQSRAPLMQETEIPSSSTSSSTKKRRVPETVVFEAGSRTSKASPEEARAARMGLKDFMSSKVQRVGSGMAGSSSATATATADDDEEERSSLANDKALSHLLSTTLFAPGTSIGASAAVGLSHRDTAARLAELSASTSSRKGAAAGRGWGEARVKADALASMPAHMRAGMRRAEADRTSKEVERAKELGIYHPSLKRGLGRTPGSDLIMGTRDKDRKARTREKGMGVGVGRFKGGMLHLSKDEVGHLAGSSNRNGVDKSIKAKGKKRK